jgi:addiction module RelE/StbE family toxin
VKVNWRATAYADLRRIFDYVAEEDPLAAQCLARELVLAADSLQQFPDRGRPGLVSGTRELVLVRPYVMVYEVTETVTILRVWHSAQNRERWSMRFL